MATTYLVQRNIDLGTWVDEAVAEGNTGTEAIREVVAGRNLDAGRFRAVPTRNITEAEAEVERNPTVKVRESEPAILTADEAVEERAGAPGEFRGAGRVEEGEEFPPLAATPGEKLPTL